MTSDLQIDQKKWLVATNWLFDKKKWLNELQIDKKSD